MWKHEHLSAGSDMKRTVVFCAVYLTLGFVNCAERVRRGYGAGGGYGGGGYGGGGHGGDSGSSNEDSYANYGGGGGYSGAGSHSSSASGSFGFGPGGEDFSGGFAPSHLIDGLVPPGLSSIFDKIQQAASGLTEQIAKQAAKGGPNHKVVQVTSDDGKSGGFGFTGKTDDGGSYAGGGGYSSSGGGYGGGSGFAGGSNGANDAKAYARNAGKGQENKGFDVNNGGSGCGSGSGCSPSKGYGGSSCGSGCGGNKGGKRSNEPDGNNHGNNDGGASGCGSGNGCGYSDDDSDKIEPSSGFPSIKDSGFGKNTDHGDTGFEDAKKYDNKPTFGNTAPKEESANLFENVFGNGGNVGFGGNNDNKSEKPNFNNKGAELNQEKPDDHGKQNKPENLKETDFGGNKGYGGGSEGPKKPSQPDLYDDHHGPVWSGGDETDQCIQKCKMESGFQKSPAAGTKPLSYG